MWGDTVGNQDISDSSFFPIQGARGYSSIGIWGHRVTGDRKALEDELFSPAQLQELEQLKLGAAAGQPGELQPEKLLDEVRRLGHYPTERNLVEKLRQASPVPGRGGYSRYPSSM